MCLGDCNLVKNLTLLSTLKKKSSKTASPILLIWLPCLTSGCSFISRVPLPREKYADNSSCVVGKSYESVPKIFRLPHKAGNYKFWQKKKKAPLHISVEWKTICIFKVEVFWVVTLYSLMAGCQRFGGLCCLRLHPRLEASPPWKLQNRQ